MRFIHTGDIHLGATPESKRPWAANRGDEIWNTLERLIKKIKIDPVDLLIIAGDMFHRQPCMGITICFYLFSMVYLSGTPCDRQLFCNPFDIR